MTNKSTNIPKPSDKNDAVDLKTILVTGANSGMGKALSLELAALGHNVIMLCRDKARGEAARDEIVKKHPQAKLSLRLCDLASLNDIRRFANEFHADFPKLDVLVNI